jgi:hypothetical protein
MEVIIIVQGFQNEIILDSLNPMAGVCTKRRHKIQRRWLCKDGALYLPAKDI